MIKYNYYKLSKSKKIRYLKNDQKDKLYIVFLHGFMSDLNGKKPKTFLNFAKNINLVFLPWNILGMENHLESLLMEIFQNGLEKQKY